MYETVFFEICGVCNARCPWCVTGKKSPLQAGGKLIDPDTFTQALDRLDELELIDSKSVIHLYSWGEPFLHPRLDDLLTILSSKRLRFGLSTNCSKLRPLRPEHLPSLFSIILSFPGFSRRSFEKINGFDFGSIQRNVLGFIDHSRKNGFAGPIRMAFHIYQFNIDEIRTALEFCRRYGIEFAPVIALFGDYEFARRYFTGELDKESLKRAGQDLLLYDLEEKIKERPPGYQCRQYSFLSLDEECNVLTCCGLPRNYEGYSIGSVFTLSRDEIEVKKRNVAVCRQCSALGLDYLGNKPNVPPFAASIRSMVENEALARDLKSHFDTVTAKRLGEFINALSALLRSNDQREAINYYNQYRWCFPNVPVVKQVDELMSRVNRLEGG